MDWDTIELNWAKYQQYAREKWHRIPETTLDNLNGSRERLIEAIEQAYEVSKEQAQREVNFWAKEAPRLAKARSVEETRRLAQQASTAPATARRRFAELREQSGERGGTVARQVSEGVRTHPGAAFLIAVGFGMLLGQLALRRR
jgi:ElaB/YqjD/DUF883 family membrane-anchored ribosome-binding protein